MAIATAPAMATPCLITSVPELFALPAAVVVWTAVVRADVELELMDPVARGMYSRKSPNSITHRQLETRNYLIAGMLRTSWA